MESEKRINEASARVGNELKRAYSFAQAVDILLASVARRLSAFEDVDAAIRWQGL